MDRKQGTLMETNMPMEVDFLPYLNTSSHEYTNVPNFSVVYWHKSPNIIRCIGPDIVLGATFVSLLYLKFH